jgi:hypothetical protein
MAKTEATARFVERIGCNGRAVPNHGKIHVDAEDVTFGHTI